MLYPNRTIQVLAFQRVFTCSLLQSQIPAFYFKATEITSTLNSTKQTGSTLASAADDLEDVDEVEDVDRYRVSDWGEYTNELCHCADTA